jgi:hypothetical protein
VCDINDDVTCVCVQAAAVKEGMGLILGHLSMPTIVSLLTGTK